MAALQPIPMRRELRLDASPAELWPLVSNTERFNRALGLPAMTNEGPAAPGSFEKKVSASLFGMTLRWRELPFEWVEGRWFRSVREFESGPVTRFEGGMELRQTAGGTEAVVESIFTPRNALGTAIVKYATGKRSVEDAVRMLRRFDSFCRTGEDPFPARRTKTPFSPGALAQKAAALHDAACSKELAAKVLHFVEHGYDDELTGIRPFELADRWGADRCATLKVFLHATRAGLFDLSWQVLCPCCKGANASPHTLKELSSKAHCGACEIEYGVDFDRSVEVRFSVSPTVRPVQAHTFCVGSPARSRDAVLQLRLRPGKPREELVDLGAESFLLHDLDHDRVTTLRPSEGGPSELAVDLSALPEQLAFKPGTVKLSLTPGAEPALLRLERESWKQKGATASFVTTLQDFRDLFSSEVLAPGVEIAVRTVALLFTDLKGSTALYEKVGDATAYAIVRDHFDYLFAIIRAHDGAVVKTIGDAVMAVFASPARALEAALQMQERVGELNTKLSPKPSVILKIGVHAGPSIAINNDNLLDYFGSSVNIAARVQNESAGGDIVITEALRRDKEVEDLIAAHGARQEPLRVQLKGLSKDFQLWRLLPRA
jgi:class 3 adenylate cyclase